MQYDLQKQVLGAGFWDAVGLQRHKLEQSLQCETTNDLLDELKRLLSDGTKEESRSGECYNPTLAIDTHMVTPPSSPSHRLSPPSSPSHRLKTTNKYAVASPTHRNTHRLQKLNAGRASLCNDSEMSTKGGTTSEQRKMKKKEKLKAKIKKELRAARQKCVKVEQ